MKRYRFPVSIVAALFIAVFFLAALPQIAQSRTARGIGSSPEPSNAQVASSRSAGDRLNPAPLGKQVRSDSIRQLTGSDAHLRQNLDEGTIAGSCIRFELQPVNPYPGGGSYPPGTTIGANSISLPGGSAQRIWLEVRISNWACAGGMAAWQAALGLEANLPVGIVKPDQPCGSAADCTAAGFGPGTGAACGIGEAGFCDAVFMQQAANQPTALNFELEACNPIPLVCGAAQALSAPINDDSAVHYAMTAVLEVTAAFAGITTIDFQGPNVDTFFLNTIFTEVPINELVGATLTVGPPPTGRCCFNIGLGTTQCIDGVLSTDCDAQPAPRLFTSGALCADGCPECVNAAQCADSLFCSGDETCGPPGQCVFPLVRDCEDGNPCTIDTCDEVNDACDHVVDQECLDDTGACCNRQPGAGGTCTDGVRPDQCTGPDRFWFRDTLCSQITCAEIGGACCNTQTGDCTETLVMDCQGPDLVWTRDATCSQIECDPPPIPCCLPNAVCGVLPRSECEAIAGVQVPTCLGDGNGNNLDDACDSDCDQDGILNIDEVNNAQKDCNNNGVCDGVEIVGCQPGCDCDGNGVLDACESDCNGNGIKDTCDIANCPGDPACSDINNNGRPDACDPDCDHDGVPDDVEITNCPPGDSSCSDCNSDGVPDGCSTLGACCYEPSGRPVCFMTNRVNCEAWFGGIWDPCGNCALITDAVQINEGGTVFYHRVNSEEHCMPPGGSQEKSREGCAGSVTDPWVSRPGAGAMCQDFGVPGYAVPAGFFGPGSDPFMGISCYRGVPLGLPQFGLADTLISRTADPFPRCSLPSEDELNVFVLISALHLESTAPIVVTYNGGQTPESWDLEVGLSTVVPPVGMLAARKTHCNGGTYTISVNGQARFTFTRVSDGTELVLDTGQMGIPPITLSSAGPMPWIHDIDPRFLLVADPCTDFHPGGVDLNAQSSCDCNGNGIRDKCDIENGISQDCNGNGRPDSCDIIEGISQNCDAINGNSMPDECQPNCNGNSVIDACDLIAGTSDDDNANTVPDECERGVASPSADSVKKNRYLSFRPGGSSGGGAAPVIQALRVTSPDFPGWFKWVTAPDANRISGLGCAPHYRAWGFGMLHVTGRDILPNKTYIVEGIALGGNTADPVHYSKPPTSVLTREKFGDIKAPFGGDGQPNFVDIEACVDTFRVRPNALPVPVADIAPETPDKTVNFVDIEALVKAFRTFPYPYGQPLACQ